MTRFRHILVPIDGSPSSQKALDEAMRLAIYSGAKVTLIHVIDELSHLTDFETGVDYVQQHLPRMRAAGERLLASAGEKVLAHGLQVECVLIAEGPGRICEHVAEHARLSHADLIVLGSHGRRGIGRILLGSDAEQIIRYSPVPVLVVRGNDNPEAATLEQT
jgi:nucleotide-binding universal stress UspA family protein